MSKPIWRATTRLTLGFFPTQPPQDRPPNAAAATDSDAVAFRSTSNSSAMIVSIPASARMRPAHQLASAQHQLAGRDVGAPDPLLNSAAVERRLRRAVQWGKITGGGHILGRSGDFSPILLIPIDAGKKISIIASVHVGCFELLAIERIRSIADLKGKTVGPDLGTSSHVFVSTMAAHVGLDPAKDINWVRSPSISPMELFADGKIDAWLGFPPDVGPVAFVCTENLIRIDCVTESGLILKRVVKRHLLGARIRETRPRRAVKASSGRS